jgi:hypothetical protein
MPAREGSAGALGLLHEVGLSEYQSRLKFKIETPGRLQQRAFSASALALSPFCA